MCCHCCQLELFVSGAGETSRGSSCPSSGHKESKVEVRGVSVVDGHAHLDILKRKLGVATVDEAMQHCWLEHSTPIVEMVTRGVELCVPLLLGSSAGDGQQPGHHSLPHIWCSPTASRWVHTLGEGPCSGEVKCLLRDRGVWFGSHHLSHA